MPNILALDISSTAIGWCYLQPDRTPLMRSIALGGKTSILPRAVRRRRLRPGRFACKACGIAWQCGTVEAPVGAVCQPRDRARAGWRGAGRAERTSRPGELRLPRPNAR